MPGARAGRQRRLLGWARLGLASCGLALSVCFLALLLQVVWGDLPSEPWTPDASLVLLDRSGQPLATLRDARGELIEPVRLEQLSPWLVPALIAAEDKRFFEHPGVDPIALGRAVLWAISERRIVSGASTITQQLARTLFERPRSLAGKWRELGLALRLELTFSKSAILEAYFNRVDFGPRLRGVAAASRHYFDKPARALSLAEAAALVAVVRGPTRYDPERSPDRLRRRRDHVLGRMLELGLADGPSVERARQSPVSLHPGYVAPGAFHFVRAAAQGKWGASVAPRGVLHSTLDAALQREVESALHGFAARFSEHRASAAAVIVVENDSSAVRAYVGSPDYHSRRDLGQNDGALALRQPGSTLKPFVYALGMQELGLHVASILPDVERRFLSSEGSYLPQNYDRRQHGPVRLGQALAASLNLPAVALAERLGPERVLGFLRDLGFAHLDGSGRDYGPALALGVAEVRLVELAAAYATLGRGGLYLPLRYFESEPVEAPRRVISAAVSRQILEILADPRERAATFGRGGPLEFEPALSVKTGTSKGNRDNWAVGVTSELSVAVWVGNFDGTPMLRSSGASGAGPLFHAVMDAALRELVPTHRLQATSLGSEARRICALSGMLAGPACPEPLPERFWTGSLPLRICDWHRSDDSGQAPLELLPQHYSAWAHDTGRLPPPVARLTGSASLASSRAAGTASLQPLNGPRTPGQPEIVFPRASAVFVLDGHLEPAQQQIVLAAQAAADARLVFELDGAVVCEVALPFRCPWQLARGKHVLSVREASGPSQRVHFSVQ
jgi:penicillin-binding protein 1C